MAKIKANGGNFYIDNVTIKQDKKTLYVAEDINGNLTDEGVTHMLADYAVSHDGTHTGTTHMESAVIDGELNSHAIVADVVKQGNVDLLHEIQNLEIAVRELKAANGDNFCVVHMYNIYSPDGDATIGMRASMSVTELAPYIRKNKLLIAHNSDNHTITPMFMYDYDVDDTNNIIAIYWYQQDAIYNKILLYKQTDSDVAEFISNGG